MPDLLPEADFANATILARFRDHKWQEQRARVASDSPFLRRLWGDRSVPDRLEELAALPLCDKQMLRESQALHPPFGDYLACAADLPRRLHRTSGTTGQAMNLVLSARDADITAEVGGRAQRAAGLGPGQRVVHCLNYQLWMGGVCDHMTLERTGALVVPFGVGSSRLLIETIRALGIEAISCTPSYPAVLAQVLEDEFPGLEPRDLGLKLGLFGGEPGLDDPAFRERLARTWGMAPRNANYGVSDVFCNFAGQCDLDTDLHFVAADVLHAELISPDTAEPMQLDTGAEGELVLTHLVRDCQPLVRFRTGDILRITGTDSCACGRTGFRFRVIGRSDDMVVIRGINVFPTMVAAVINTQQALSGEYRIRLRGPGPYDRLPLEAELARPDQPEDAAQALAAAVRRELRVSADITLLPFGSLPRTAGKTRRVIREP